MPVRKLATTGNGTGLTQTGYTFTRKSPYNFYDNGTFAVLSNLVVSQLPVFKLVYKPPNKAATMPTPAR